MGPARVQVSRLFINDEDLLSRFAAAPLQDGVFSLEMWDRIYETLLRLRANTIIPGTFTFPDERMQVLAARRGLFNSQHHICVVGLNTFQWPPDKMPYSYLTIPAPWNRHADVRRCLEDRDGLDGRLSRPARPRVSGPMIPR